MQTGPVATPRHCVWRDPRHACSKGASVRLSVERVRSGLEPSKTAKVAYRHHHAGAVPPHHRTSHAGDALDHRRIHPRSPPSGLLRLSNKVIVGAPETTCAPISYHLSSSLTRSLVWALSSKGKVWHSKWNCRRIGCTPEAVRPRGAPRVGGVGSHTSHAAVPRRQGLRGPEQRLRTTGPGGRRSIPGDGGARRGYKVERGLPVVEGECKAREFLTRQRLSAPALWSIAILCGQGCTCAEFNGTMAHQAQHGRPPRLSAQTCRPAQSQPGRAEPSRPNLRHFEQAYSSPAVPNLACPARPVTTL